MADEALRYDAIIIGAGHNGLVAAAYLAKRGLKVLVLDGLGEIGGGARTTEISPDYRVSAAAHLISAFPKKIEKDLKLGKHGLAWAARNTATVALDLQGRHITLPQTGNMDRSSLVLHEPLDGDAWQRFERRIDKFAGFLKPLLEKQIPKQGPGADERAGILAAMRLEKMGRDDLQSFLRFVPSSIAAILDRYFEGELLKGALALDALLGQHAGPHTAGSAFTYLYKRTLAAQGQGLGYPVGGVGALADALGSAAEAFGARIRLDSLVKEILVDEGRATGVRLSEGTVFHAPIIMSSTDPKGTCLEMVGARHFETTDVRHFKRMHRQGAAAKINLALEGLPTFANFTDRQYGGRLLIAPDMRTVERSFTAAKRNELPLDPVMEMVIPSYHDPRLAPIGHHVLSIIVPNVPYHVEGGWDARRDGFVKRVIDTIAQYAPDITDKIISGEVLTPPEIETKFGLAGGHWYQCDMSFDQLLAFRPAPGMANYATGVEGLYLCGVGTHPGGGLSGMSGKLAAETVLAQRKSK